MIENLLAELQAIDSAILSDAASQDQRNPAFKITEWPVNRLSDKGISNPNGLWLYSGSGHVSGDARPWSVVLKVVERWQPELPPGARNY